jgi:hypothetical protein
MGHNPADRNTIDKQIHPRLDPAGTVNVSSSSTKLSASASVLFISQLVLIHNGRPFGGATATQSVLVHLL